MIGAADETFFGNVLILVFMDLSSSYLILEDIADDKSFDTWLKMLEPRLEELGVNVPLMVPDRAKALIKLALVGLKCEHNADIFHSLHDISKWMDSTLGRRKSTAKRQLDKCEQAKDIEVLACKHGINDNTGVMKKFKNQIKELVPSIDLSVPFFCEPQKNIRNPS